jgi:hypothetical protein
VAQALFVTTKTVKDHLGSAYGKLQISSRTELAGALAGGRASSLPSANRTEVRVDSRAVNENRVMALAA